MLRLSENPSPSADECVLPLNFDGDTGGCSGGGHWSLAAIGDAQLMLDVDPTLADGRERTYPHTALYQGSRANVEYGHHQPREAM
jgi:hypothetical protein